MIAGEISSDARAYTAVGEQVGLAQRMESVAPPGGVMLSESTARLVEHATVLGAPEWVHVKGAEEPLPARRLLGAAAERVGIGRREPTLVGRTWEMNTVAGILEQAISGAGCVVGVVGPPGIGKSRIMREAVTLATGRGVEVFTVACESHTREVPFRAGGATAADGVRGQRPRRAGGPGAGAGPHPRRQPRGPAAARRPARHRRPGRRAARHHRRCPSAPAGGLVERRRAWPAPRRRNT